MILVDTSVWIAHLRSGDSRLISLLDEDEVLIHPFVIGELACGTIRNRSEVFRLVRALPLAVAADHEEVMEFVENHRVFGRGLGWVDAHLLASTMLSRARLLTVDRPLLRFAAALKIAA